MSATAFISFNNLHHHAGDSPKTGSLSTAVLKVNVQGFTSLDRIWLSLILDYASFQRIGLTFIVNGLSAVRLSHQNDIKTSFPEKLENLFLLEADYPPLKSFMFKTAQDVDTRRKIKKKVS